MTEQNQNNTTPQIRTQSSSQNGSSLRGEILELNKNLKLLTNANRKRNVILRGLMNGVFTAIGASLGFALFLSGFSSFLQKAENLPFLDRLIDKTHLNLIIERYLRDLERPTPVPTALPTSIPVRPTSTPVPSNTPTPEVEITPADVAEEELF